MKVGTSDGIRRTETTRLQTSRTRWGVNDLDFELKSVNVNI